MLDAVDIHEGQILAQKRSTPFPSEKTYKYYLMEVQEVRSDNIIVSCPGSVCMAVVSEISGRITLKKTMDFEGRKWYLDSLRECTDEELRLYESADIKLI